MLWAALAALMVTSGARAQGRVQFLTERLKYPGAASHPDDFRVRTNAALALGATDDAAAVPPLCAALSDPSDVVRQAAAVALRRLSRPSALDCLKRRSEAERNAAVKQAIVRATEAIESAAAGSRSAASPGASIVADAKFYVALSRVTNHTSRDSEEVERIVRDAIASKLAEAGSYQLAPAGETGDAAKAMLAKRKLKGYFLSASVDRFDYSDEGLRVRVKIAVFSYPGKDLRGEVPAGAMLPGARPGDTGSENQLMGVAAASAAELFAQNFR